MSKTVVSSPDLREEGGSDVSAWQSFPLVASPETPVVPDSEAPPKRKRGRPRKNLPADVLAATSSRPPVESFDDDFFGDDPPFYDDELSTLDEFDRMSRSPGNRTGDAGSINRVDKGGKTPDPVSLPRRKKVTRRRQIDPATCERDYSRDEVEFMNALNEYKRSSGRMFPTCSEILEVLLTLGYEKRENLE